MRPTWGPPGTCRPQMGIVLAPWTLLSGYLTARCHINNNRLHSPTKAWFTYLYVRHHTVLLDVIWKNIMFESSDSFYSHYSAAYIKVLHKVWQRRSRTSNQVELTAKFTLKRSTRYAGVTYAMLSLKSRQLDFYSTFVYPNTNKASKPGRTGALWGKGICAKSRVHHTMRHIQYIPRNMHTVFALLCFVVVIHWLIFPYPSGLLTTKPCAYFLGYTLHDWHSV